MFVISSTMYTEHTAIHDQKRSQKYHNQLQILVLAIRYIRSIKYAFMQILRWTNNKTQKQGGTADRDDHDKTVIRQLRNLSDNTDLYPALEMLLESET
jgi:D-mannonate dehydratase